MPTTTSEPSIAWLPRWRGANLLALYRPEAKRFDEREFEWLASWGFDFARLPLCWRTWSAPDRWREADSTVLGWLDEAVAFGERHGIHVQLNFHHAPGFCVHAQRMADEPWDLWRDPTALEACAYHWGLLARRYQGIPNSRLSFNPLNEPVDPAPEDHRRVIATIIAAIQAEDPDRLVICDGTRWARRPADELVGLPCAHSLHGYDPIQMVFYGLKGLVDGAEDWPEPSWPLQVDSTDPHWQGNWDRARLQRTWIKPWKRFQEKNTVGLHVGEFGISSSVPQATSLAWLGDALALWREAGWGWALWNIYGPFGFLDNKRQDATLDRWHGHTLDRSLLELLQKS